MSGTTRALNAYRGPGHCLIVIEFACRCSTAPAVAICTSFLAKHPHSKLGYRSRSHPLLHKELALHCCSCDSIGVWSEHRLVWLPSGASAFCGSPAKSACGQLICVHVSTHLEYLRRIYTSWFALLRTSRRYRSGVLLRLIPVSRP